MTQPGLPRNAVPQAGPYSRSQVGYATDQGDFADHVLIKGLLRQNCKFNDFGLRDIAFC